MKYEEALEKVKQGHFFNDYKILKLTRNGWSIAHEQAYRGWITEDPKILKIDSWSIMVRFREDRDYEDKPEIYPLMTSVAHIQVFKSNWITFSQEILSLKSYKASISYEAEVLSEYDLGDIFYYTIKPGTVLETILSQSEARAKFITELSIERFKTFDSDAQKTIVSELVKEIPTIQTFEFLKKLFMLNNM